MGGQPPRRSALRTAAISLATAGIAAVVGFAAIYVTLGRPDNAPGNIADKTAPPAGIGAPNAPAAQDMPKGPGSNPLSQGHMAAFVFSKEPLPLPRAAMSPTSDEDEARPRAKERNTIVPALNKPIPQEELGR